MPADERTASRRPAEVVLVRHGQTEWSLDGRHTGRTDIPLTEEGRVQALALAPTLAGWKFSRVYSSPFERARETATLAGIDANAIELLDNCHEWDYGDYEGVTTEDIRSGRPGWSLWDDGCPNGEQAADVGIRVDRVIALSKKAGGDVAIFAHGHVLRVLAARWVGLAAQEGKALALSTASISVLGYEREDLVVLRWNWTATPS